MRFLVWQFNSCHFWLWFSWILTIERVLKLEIIRNLHRHWIVLFQALGPRFRLFWNWWLLFCNFVFRNYCLGAKHIKALCLRFILNLLATLKVSEFPLKFFNAVFWVLMLLNWVCTQPFSDEYIFVITKSNILVRFYIFHGLLAYITKPGALICVNVLVDLF